VLLRDRLRDVQPEATELDPGAHIDLELPGVLAVDPRLAGEDVLGIWEETHPNVEVIDGVFGVVLGSLMPLTLDLFENEELWLSVTVENDDEISPRMQLTSTPWSFWADVADTAIAGPGGGGVCDGHSLDAADGDPVDVVYVDNDGRVGVGTQTPDLAVGVDIAKRTLITHSGVSCVFSGNPDYDLFYLAAFEEGNSTVKKPIVMNPWGGGYFGIGTPTPGALLHAVGGPSPQFILAGNQQTEQNTTTLYLSHVAHENSQKVAIISQAIGAWGKGKLHLAVNQENNNSNADTTDAKITIRGDGNVGIGTRNPQETLQLLKRIAGLQHLSIQGLMTMPPWFEDPEDARPYFIALRKLRDKLSREKLPGIALQELSMGMSGDFEVAIEEGATLVRIGTAIFGPRSS